MDLYHFMASELVVHISLYHLLAMVPDQPRTNVDMVLAPTEYQSKYGVFTVQIPQALDSKDSSGTDIPFRVTMDLMIFTAQNFMRSNIIEYCDCI
jgi:hypothetical protein